MNLPALAAQFADHLRERFYCDKKSDKWFEYGRGRWVNRGDMEAEASIWLTSQPAEGSSRKLARDLIHLAKPLLPYAPPRRLTRLDTNRHSRYVLAIRLVSQIEVKDGSNPFLTEWSQEIAELHSIVTGRLDDFAPHDEQRGILEAFVKEAEEVLCGLGVQDKIKQARTALEERINQREALQAEIDELQAELNRLEGASD